MVTKDPRRNDSVIRSRNVELAHCMEEWKLEEWRLEEWILNKQKPY
jgi:hypothetical protein